MASKTELILHAYRELIRARISGDRKSERVWREAVDRLLDEYIEERQTDAD